MSPSLPPPTTQTHQALLKKATATISLLQHLLILLFATLYNWLPERKALQFMLLLLLTYTGPVCFPNSRDVMESSGIIPPHDIAAHENAGMEFKCTDRAIDGYCHIIITSTRNIDIDLKRLSKIVE
jgi:hypothetical protein